MRRKIKITATSKEGLTLLFEMIMNVSSVMCMAGRIPSPDDIADPRRTGLFWYRDGDKIQLYPMTNDYWAHVIEENETDLVINFNIRYGQETKINALETMVRAFFPDNTEFVI